MHASLGIHLDPLNSCQASWWAVHEPRPVGSPNLFTHIRSKMRCNCLGVCKRCLSPCNLFCQYLQFSMRSKFPAFAQQPLVGYLYPELISKRILVLKLLIVSWLMSLPRSLYCACPKSNLVAERILHKVFASTEMQAFYFFWKINKQFFINESRQSLDF